VPKRIFPHQQQLYEYAERNGLACAWEGTTAFDAALRTMLPQQYHFMAVGARRVLLYPRQKDEHRSHDGPHHQGPHR
jgi:hypothetical protein